MLILLPMDIQKTLLALLGAGLTQAKIADELGCSQPAVSGMVNGKLGKSRPSYQIVDGIKRLAKEMGIQVIESEKK